MNLSSTSLPRYLRIDTEMKNYSYLFEMLNSTDEKAFLEIGFADTVNDVWINNIWVEKID